MTTSTADDSTLQQDDGSEQPSPPAKPPRQIPDMPRRLFFLTMGAAAVTTAFKANIAADALLTERSQYHISTPDNAENRTAALRFPGKTWYLLGGFRVSYRDAGRKLAALQPAMNERAPASFIGYSNEGIDIAQLFIAIHYSVLLVIEVNDVLGILNNGRCIRSHIVAVVAYPNYHWAALSSCNKSVRIV